MPSRWDTIRARVAELGRAEVRTGIVGTQASVKHADSDLTNAEIGMLHEFGNPSTNLPERSFIRATLRDPGVQRQFAALQRRLVKAVMDGRMSRDKALGQMGAFMAGQIQETITQDKVKPPLAPATIKAKQSEKVLIETGQLVGSITWELVK